MFEFDLAYFLKEFETFRTLYGRVSKDKFDLAYKGLLHLFSITVIKNEEENAILKTAFDIATDEWFRYRDMSKTEK